MTWIFCHPVSSEVGVTFPNPEVGDADEANNDCQDVEPHL